MLKFLGKRGRTLVVLILLGSLLGIILFLHCQAQELRSWGRPAGSSFIKMIIVKYWEANSKALIQEWMRMKLQSYVIKQCQI